MDPQIAGALGGALIAKDLLEEGSLRPAAEEHEAEALEPSR